MRTRLRHFLVLFFALCFVLCFAGCTIKADISFLNEKVVEMIDLEVKHDTEGAYALLYPGVMDPEAYRSTVNQIYEYFPVTEGYKWELKQWNVTKGVNNDDKTYEGQYNVEFDGKVFLIFVDWHSDKEGSGFRRFQIVSEEDWNASQKK